MFVYGIFLYICGLAGDKFDVKLVLSLAFAGIGVFYILLSFAGFFDMTSLVYYYFASSGIGVVNAFIYPCLVALLGFWFPKKTRGLVVGAWASCNNLGDIVGIQIGAVLITAFNGRWEILQLMAGLAMIALGVVVFFFLVPHPDNLGITVEEVANLNVANRYQESLNPDGVTEVEEQPK